jgi:hypothetical protein
VEILVELVGKPLLEERVLSRLVLAKDPLALTAIQR